MNEVAKSAVLSLMGAVTPFIWQQSAALDAAQPAGNDAGQLETIVVTAEKREEPLMNVPMSVTALGGGSLDKLQDRNFSDYAAMVPGLSLESSQPGLTRLTLRGENAGGVGSTVAVYLDESPFGSSSALLNGSILSGDFDTWDLQRIEVLRGPQGTLYGSNSEGGLLKFVTTAPVLGSFSGAAEVTGESVDHGGQGGDVRAVLNLPLGEKMAFRISGFDQDVPGYINDPLSGKDGVNDGHKEGGRASLLAAPTDDLSIRLTATSQQSKYNGTGLIDVNVQHPIHDELRHSEFGYVQRCLEPTPGARSHRLRPPRWGDWAESRRLPRRPCKHGEVHARDSSVIAAFGSAGVAGWRLLHPRDRRRDRTSERNGDTRRHARRPSIVGNPNHSVHL
jgi:iron complex outermembrane receptor protein